MTLDYIHKMLPKIRESAMKEFETEKIIIIPRQVVTNSREGSTINIRIPNYRAIAFQKDSCSS